MARLFTEIAQFTQFLPGETNVSLQIVEPRIDDVIGRYIVPVLGEEFLQSKLDMIGGEDEPSDVDRGLIKAIRKSVVHLTMAISTPDLNVTASNGGFTVGEGERTNIASAERVRQYVELRSQDAQLAMDELIRFLDKHSEADELADYSGSSEEAAQCSNFINSVDSLNKYLFTRPGRWVFEQLRPVMSYVEEMYILPVLCDELYAHLKEIITTRNKEDGALNFGDYKPLIRHIERAVSHYSLAFGMNEIGLKVTSDGGIYKSFYKNANEPLQSKEPSETTFQRQYEFNMRQGAEALKALKTELLKNVVNYPLYGESACYTLGEQRRASLDTDEQPTGGLNLIGVK